MDHVNVIALEEKEEEEKGTESNYGVRKPRAGEYAVRHKIDIPVWNKEQSLSNSVGDEVSGVGRKVTTRFRHGSNPDNYCDS